jgi:hypothetical protein
MAYRYTDEEIKRIGGSGLTRGEPVNRFNAKLLPELIKYAERDLAKAMKSKKPEAIKVAQETLDVRMEKQRAYKLAFPNGA